MGKGDRKTAKGKRYNASYGNARSHTASKVAVGSPPGCQEDRGQGSGEEGCGEEGRRQGLIRSNDRSKENAAPGAAFYARSCRAEPMFGWRNAAEHGLALQGIQRRVCFSVSGLPSFGAAGTCSRWASSG